MLKISILDSASHRRLMLEGRLVAPWTDMVKSACRQAKADLHGRQLVIDLKCVTAISGDGERVLVELLEEGIKFRSSGVFTKLVMKQLGRKNWQNSRENKR